MIADHLTCAIEDIDVQVANMNAAIDAMRDQVDVLVDARVALLGLRDRVDGTIPLHATSPTVAVEPEPVELDEEPSEEPPVDPVVHRPRGTKTNGASKSKYDLVEVAQIANDAITSGSSPVDALIEHTDCPSEAMARYLMTSARAAGHDIPRLRRAKRTGTSKPPPSAGDVPLPRNPAIARLDPATVANLEQQAGLS